MRPKLKSLLCSSLAGILILTIPTTLYAQHYRVHRRARTLERGESIPVQPTPAQPTLQRGHYKSWSLFLVCNPEWIKNNGDEGIHELFYNYQIFGDAIGSDNLAVWFSKNPNEPATVANTDIERMADYCTKFGLLPSQTPQVVTTTRYPEDPGVNARGVVVVSLNGNAKDSAAALSDLNDELRKTDLDQSALNSKKWRREIRTAASALTSSTSCYLNKVSISIKTGVFNLEIAHSSDRKC